MRCRRRQQGALELPADPSSRQAFHQLCLRLSRLKERERCVLWMCLVERQEAAEAAEALGVSVPTIRRTLARARRRLASWGESDPFLCEFAPAPSHQGGVT